MKLKSKFFISFLLFFVLASISRIALAQDNSMRVGIKGGLNVSNLYIEDVDDENARYGFHLGVYTQLFESDKFAIQPELLYSTKGNRTTYDELGFQGDVKFNLNYLDIPVLAVFKLGDAAEIHIGPYFGYLISASSDIDGDFDDYQELDRKDYKAWDYGISGGVGFNVGVVQIGARYNYGLQKIADSDATDFTLGDAKNSNAQLYVSFNFNQ